MREATLLDRRSLLRRAAWGICAGAVTGFSAARAATLSFGSLDHVECWVASALASAEFYARVFGNQVLKNRRTERRYIRLGESYLAVDQGQAAHVDHLCVGVPDFQIASAHEFLAERSIAHRDYPSGRDTAITEPGGQRIQLAADHGWDLLLTGTAAPEELALAGPAVFTPIGLESALMRVPDLEASSRYLSQIFGAAALAQGAIPQTARWFAAGRSRLGLISGQPGVEYLRVTARAFDPRSAVLLLAKLGVGQSRTLGATEIEFADPDGYRIRVTST